MTEVSVHRTAGMLGLFSVLVLVEGVVRVTRVLAANHDSGEDLNADWDGINGNTFPEWVAFVGALLEMIAATVGLALAMGVMIFESHHPGATRLGLSLMLSLWFTFIVFVFAKPVFDVSKLDFSPHPNLTLRQVRGLVTLGILGSAGYCGALQGGQVFFAWQLWRIGLGDESRYTKQYHASRLTYYSALALVAGIAQMAIGILVRDEVGDGRLTGIQRVALMPFFVVYPSLNVTTGLLVTIAAVAGLVRSYVRHAGGKMLFPALWAVVWMVQILFMGVTQPGLWSTGPALAREELVFASSLLVALTLGLSIPPTYMDAMA